MPVAESTARPSTVPTPKLFVNSLIFPVVRFTLAILSTQTCSGHPWESARTASLVLLSSAINGVKNKPVALISDCSEIRAENVFLATFELNTKVLKRLGLNSYVATSQFPWTTLRGPNEYPDLIGGVQWPVNLLPSSGLMVR